MDYITNPITLQPETLLSTDTTFMGLGFRTAWVRFSSIGDPGDTIRIEGFLAMPNTGTITKPGIVVTHGNGEQGNLLTAMGTAYALQSVALSISGPGCGGSEGQPSDFENWIRIEPSVAYSWIYQYAVAAMRGVTYLSTLPEVDSTFLAMTGPSAGGVATLLSAAVDNRLKYAIPIMASGDFTKAYLADGWLSYYLGDTLNPDSGQFARFINYLDPLSYVSTHSTPTFLIVGAQDEFFTLDAVKSYLESLSPAMVRTLIVANWDHATYYGPDPRYNSRYDAFDNSAVAGRKMLQATTAGYLAIRTVGMLPPTPQVTASELFGEINFTAMVTPIGVDSVFLCLSLDSGWTYQCHQMTQTIPTTYTYSLETDQPLSSMVYFAELHSSGLIMSSYPYMSQEMELRIRPAVEDTTFIDYEVQEKETRVKVYPNPASGKLYIASKSEISQGEIYNITGKKVREFQGMQKLQFNLPAGIYFIRFRTVQGDWFTRKLLLLKGTTK